MSLFEKDLSMNSLVSKNILRVVGQRVNSITIEFRLPEPLKTEITI